MAQSSLIQEGSGAPHIMGACEVAHVNLVHWSDALCA